MPNNPVSHEAWEETELTNEGEASLGIWCRNASGCLAFKKPGQSRGVVTHEPLREFLASALAAWLNVPVPRVQLHIDPQIGPCSLSWKVPDTALTYEDVILLPFNATVRPDAERALEPYVGKIIVLDAWIGAEDRANQGNHIFLESALSWVSLDYAFSFNSNMTISGVGVADRGYGQQYLDAMKEASRLSKRVILETIQDLEAMPDTAIIALVNLVPTEFADDDVKMATLTFLIDRKARIRDIVDEWWTTMGLPGSLKEWLAKQSLGS